MKLSALCTAAIAVSLFVAGPAQADLEPGDPLDVVGKIVGVGQVQWWGTGFNGAAHSTRSEVTPPTWMPLAPPWMYLRLKLCRHPTTRSRCDACRFHGE